MEAIYCSLDQAKAGVRRDDFVFWDTRSDDEYTGDEAGFRSPPRQTYVVHGEPHAADQLAATLRATLGWNARPAEDRREKGLSEA